MADETPKTMRRLVLKEAAQDLVSAKIEFETLPMPSPSASQVLVKVAAAPVNPSDYGCWRSKKTDEPAMMGNEGSGVVVEAGWAARMAGVGVGTKVGFVGAVQGAYSEYATVPIATAFPMPDDLPVEDACSFFVNPFTALAILDMSNGAPFVHTAAASQLGCMLVKLCAEDGAADRLVNVVRSEKQKAKLEALGAKHVVICTDPKTDEAGLAAIKAKIDELKVTVVFDCVAGAMTGKLMGLLPPKSTLYIYGTLAGDIECLAPVEFIYRQKKLEGLYLTTWLFGGMLPGSRLVRGPAQKPFNARRGGRL